MPLIETESIVLKSYSLSEADRIVVFLTEDHGVVRGVARGAKRLKSRFGSTLEPFTTVRLAYFQKEDRELVSIQDIELIQTRFGTASDPGFLQAFSYLAEILSELVPPHDPNELLYRMVRASLRAGDPQRPESLLAISLYFEVWLLRLGGYLPDWSRCASCSHPFPAGLDAYLQRDFSLACEKCQAGGNGVIKGAPGVSPEHREVLANVQKLTPEIFAARHAADAVFIGDLSELMKRLIGNVLGRDGVKAKSLAVKL